MHFNHYHNEYDISHSRNSQSRMARLIFLNKITTATSAFDRGHRQSHESIPVKGDIRTGIRKVSKNDKWKRQRTLEQGPASTQISRGNKDKQANENRR